MARLKRIKQNHIQLELFPHNYEVNVNGKVTALCDTEEQAWKAIGKTYLGDLWYVTSPTGQNTDASCWKPRAARAVNS